MRIRALFFASLLPLLSQVQADDTELYVFESSQRTGARPKVLIIFDNSGSMGAVDQSKSTYDPDIDYDPVLSGFFQERGIYWTASGIDNASMPVPSQPNDSRRFLEVINLCDTAKQALDKHGIYTGFLREYSKSGNSGSWEELRENNGFNENDLIECLADIQEGNPKNGDRDDGFPIDGGKPQGNDHFDVAYQTDNLGGYENNTNFGSGSPVTLYTDNYLFWFHSEDDEVGSVPKTRMEQAQQVISTVVETTPGVDIGLALFNLNFPSDTRHGGRIVQAIQQLDSAGRAELTNKINKISPDTNTPLTETLYESYRYLAGLAPHYGFADSSYKNNKSGIDYSVTDSNYLPTDPNCIGADGNYISPYTGCQGKTYVILITDGLPTADENANSRITSLPQGVGAPYKDDDITSYLPALSEWMFEHDIISPSDNYEDVDIKRNVVTYTIGFSEDAADAEALLVETAKRGGGQYFSANDYLDLQKALTDIFIEISRETASFTSPSIASNNFDRTQTLDAVYYGMFYPNTGPRWMGNLKKLRIRGDGAIVDSKGVQAIDDDGNIASRACTIWTPSATCSVLADGGDGNEVHDGGVVHMLRNNTNRTLYTDAGSNNSLVPLTTSNLINRAGSIEDLADHMNMGAAQDLSLEQTFDEQLRWVYGFDVDDDNDDSSVSEIRADVMGDPLHSKPLAITYGQADGSSDVRIVMGTNHGLLHMFKDSGDTVSESWAFAPYDLLPNSVTLRANFPSGAHTVYGVDSSPVAYVRDVNADGIIQSDQDDKVWVFVGLRRGGNAYYALDVTDPDNPELLWHIAAGDTGFDEMGQTWSEPVVTHVNGHPGLSRATAKPVVIVGGGYDSAKDKAGASYQDTRGRALYIIDAETGTMLHSFGAEDSGAVTEVEGMDSSIPNKVAALDSNGDGITDRLYATDSSANVWRFDMVGADMSKWSAYKFASLGGDTDPENRRFFSEPAVAQTAMTRVSKVDGQIAFQEKAYDAVVVGSGNRPTPLDTSRNDYFFTLRDPYVYSRNIDEDNPAPDTVTISDLYDVSSAGYDTVSSDDEQDKLDLLNSNKMGWYQEFTKSGEKSLSGAVILGGKVYFTSFVPQTEMAENQCMLEGGGRLYVRDLHRGINKLSEPYYDIGDHIPDTPQVVVPPRNSDDDGDGDGDNNGGNDSPIYLLVPKPLPTGVEMRARRIYYHIEE
ncbi:pilus assembly protein [Paraferrimonas sedimenticola]|uniref:Type IV pili system adhesin PilY n=1 Tax=Paraferrimonas sedimenticola TaxID=375674 RepID=A0AA37RXR2_9GAMM|nr:PilC/PilY family type IV pilus protein [Paraferrimonas sedimenticola]GLP97141.1 type IV pili system adhesin PilY [Paraferrimonas sedimenticola]